MICGLCLSYSSCLKLCYVLYIMLCDLNKYVAFLDFFVCTCVLYSCDLFPIRLSYDKVLDL